MIENLLVNPVWNALNTVHARFAVGRGPARRYPMEVLPFAALADFNNSHLEPLEELLRPGEQVYLFGAHPKATKRVAVGEPLDCFQMLGPTALLASAAADEVRPIRLTAEDADAMVALKRIAFPGFFGIRTHEVGTYYGVRVDGELVAMAGERLAITGSREISAVCTHPGHTGKGYANTLMTHLMQEHARDGFKSFLHVGQTNSRAIALYERLGFHVTGSIALWPLSLVIHATQ